ncbi:tryptophan 7-halogenase [Echinicola sediminis]
MFIDSINSIGILGGGSAGYFSALYLKKQFPDKEITLIESSDIPIIGVGEATTQAMITFLYHDLGFSVEEIFRKIKPTIKLGVKFQWGYPGDYYFNFPFGGLFNDFSIEEYANYNHCNLSSRLMEANKVPIMKGDNGFKHFPKNGAYAFHIDNALLVRFLQSKLEEFNCKHIDAKITGAEIDEAGISQLVTETGEKYQYDFYIDCSGFSSFLLEKSLGCPFVDYDQSLKTNSAIIGQAKHKGGIANYTTAKTMKYGWMWQTPVQGENHLGYVFSDQFCSQEEAISEMRPFCDWVNEEKMIKFRAGRHEKAWKKNVLAIGNSFGFVEPLESTGIHMVLFHLRKFKKSLLSAETNIDATNETFNKKINTAWDNVKNFIAVHFKYNRQMDTPFWKHCQETIVLDEMVQKYMDYFFENGPISLKKEHPLYLKMNEQPVFKAIAYDAYLLGMYSNEMVDKLAVIDRGNLRVGRQKIDELLIKKAINFEEALPFLESPESNAIKSWFV